MQKPQPLLSPRTTARIIRWALVTLGWIAAHVFANAPPPSRRRIRQRYRFASLGWAYRLVRALVIVRAVELTSIKERPSAPARNAAPAGFRRRVHRAAKMRATFGARARKALTAREPRERLRLLLAALRDIDGFARRYMVPRALRRLTKLYAIVMVAPPAQSVCSLAAPALTCADTS